MSIKFALMRLYFPLLVRVLIRAKTLAPNITIFTIISMSFDGSVKQWLQGGLLLSFFWYEHKRMAPIWSSLQLLLGVLIGGENDSEVVVFCRFEKSLQERLQLYFPYDYFQEF